MTDDAWRIYYNYSFPSLHVKIYRQICTDFNFEFIIFNNKLHMMSTFVKRTTTNLTFE